jgi:hypothetical protein
MPISQYLHVVLSDGRREGCQSYRFFDTRNFDEFWTRVARSPEVRWGAKFRDNLTGLKNPNFVSDPGFFTRLVYEGA